MRRASLFLFLAVVFMLVWASASGHVSLSVASGNPDAGGRVAVVTPIDQPVTVTWGKAQVVYGKSIFKIDKIAPGTANRVLIHLILTNPQDMCKVLGNPNAWIEVTVSDSADTPGNTYASGRLTREKAEVLLMPEGVPDGTTTLYIQVSIKVPGGAPPGQQEKQNLSYYCRVELRG